MDRREFRKNLLDLQYNDNLNWRSIVFGLFFIFAGSVFTYFFTIANISIIEAFAYTLSFGIIFWIFLYQAFYLKIKNNLERIEFEIESLGGQR